MNFDPIDLVLLGAGWAQGACYRANAMSIDRAGELADAAQLLQRLWLEIDPEEWRGVFGYDVAEPLGMTIGQYFLEHDSMPDAAAVEAWARELIQCEISGS